MIWISKTKRAASDDKIRVAKRSRLHPPGYVIHGASGNDLSPDQVFGWGLHPELIDPLPPVFHVVLLQSLEAVPRAVLDLIISSPASGLVKPIQDHIQVSYRGRGWIYVPSGALSSEWDVGDSIVGPEIFEDVVVDKPESI